MKMKTLDLAIILILLFGSSSCYDKFYAVNVTSVTKDYIKPKDKLRFVTFDKKGSVRRIETEQIQNINLLIRNEKGGNGVIRGEVTGTTYSMIHVVDKTGQEHSIHIDRIKRINTLGLKTGVYSATSTSHLQEVSDSTIVVAKGKRLVPFQEPIKQVAEAKRVAKPLPLYTVSIPTGKIEKIVLVVPSPGGKSEVIKGSVTSTTDSIIHILDSNGQPHSINAYQINEIKELVLKKGSSVHQRYFYTKYVHNITDSTIIIGATKDVANRKEYDFKNGVLEVRRHNGGKTLAVFGAIGVAGVLAFFIPVLLWGLTAN